jgi:hypothetical protein
LRDALGHSAIHRCQHRVDSHAPHRCACVSHGNACIGTAGCSSKTSSHHRHEVRCDRRRLRVQGCFSRGTCGRADACAIGSVQFAAIGLCCRAGDGASAWRVAVQTGPHSSSAGRGAIILARGRKRKAPSTKRTSGRFAGDTLRRRAGRFELWTGQPQRPD